MYSTIAIHGLGYVGITAAAHFARAGWAVIGRDPDPEVVRAANTGAPKAGEFLRYLGQDFTGLPFRATTEFDDTLGALIHLVAVPTEKMGAPHSAIVKETIARIYDHALPNTVLLIESTLQPDTIDNLRPRMHHATKVIGKSFFVAVCPRRDWFADPAKNLATLPRVVGGVTDACTSRAAEVLSTVSREILRTDYRTAELTKAVENTLLHVPVMFAHQLAVAYPKHNVVEALRLAGTHWRIPSLYIGFGTGGRCIPVAPQYLIAGADAPGLTIACEAVKFEDNLAMIVAKAARRHLGIADGTSWPIARAIVFGVAYRPEFRDMGRSPGLRVAKAMASIGFQVWVHDPMWTTDELEAMTGFPASGSYENNPDGYDVALLATPHQLYLDVPDDGWPTCKVFIDAHGRVGAARAPRGARYVRVGEPGWMG
jgi:nucleotide sugar dehydrogenase